MLNIDLFTVGKEFKDDQGNEYVITSNMFDGKKGLVEYEPKVVPFNEELEKEL